MRRTQNIQMAASVNFRTDLPRPPVSHRAWHNPKNSASLLIAA